MTNSIEHRLRDDVVALCALGDRAVGSPGHTAARNHLLVRFQEIGLAPYDGGRFGLPPNTPTTLKPPADRSIGASRLTRSTQDRFLRRLMARASPHDSLGPKQEGLQCGRNSVLNAISDTGRPSGERA